MYLNMRYKPETSKMMNTPKIVFYPGFDEYYFLIKNLLKMPPR